jgi:hypothetical protein
MKSVQGGLRVLVLTLIKTRKCVQLRNTLICKSYDQSIVYSIDSIVTSCMKRYTKLIKVSHNQFSLYNQLWHEWYRQKDSRNSKHCNLLLLEIPPILLIYQYQIQIIPCREFLVDIPEGRCQFESTQE